jgi:butyrate kinase
MAGRVLVVNPGSTTTKVAVFADGREVLAREIVARPEDLAAAGPTLDQLPFRLRLVEYELAAAGLAGEALAAVIGRGAPLAPVPAGTYRVNPAMLADARSDRYIDHASRLGCLMAEALARPRGIPAFIADPVSVDEYDEISRISGLPGLPRRSLTHALNIKSAARRYAAEAGRPYGELNLLIAHLGGGISVAVHHRGRMIDSADANGEGPMSPERSGALRVDDLVDLCFSGQHDRAGLKRLLTRGSGLAGHLGTTDAVEIEKRIAAGDAKARLVYEAMAYMVAKHIAGLAAAVAGRVDAVILTGGLARSDFLVKCIRQRVGFLGPVTVYPGENEMLALFQGAERVLTGREKARVYPTGEEES